MLSPSLSRGPSFNAVAAGIALSFVLGAAAVVSVIAAAPASAHTALVKITPYAGAQLTTAPTEVMLEFNEPVSPTFATVVVRTAAGQSVARSKPTVLGAKVTQPLSPDLASGVYRVAFRLVSADGHPVTGESKFTLTLTPVTRPATPAGTASASASTPSVSAPAPGPGTVASGSGAVASPSGAAVPAPRAQGPQPAQSGWLSRLFVPIAGAVGLVVIGGGVLRWDRRRR